MSTFSREVLGALASLTNRHTQSPPELDLPHPRAPNHPPNLETLGIAYDMLNQGVTNPAEVILTGPLTSA